MFNVCLKSVVVATRWAIHINREGRKLPPARSRIASANRSDTTHQRIKSPQKQQIHNAKKIFHHIHRPWQTQDRFSGKISNIVPEFDNISSVVGHTPLPNVKRHAKAREFKLHAPLLLVDQAKDHATSNAELGEGRLIFSI